MHGMPRPPSLDWDLLRTFLVAARSKTLAGASRALGVEHTTVGRRLTALETALGMPLVLRNPSGLELTAQAKKLLPLIQGVEKSVAAVEGFVTTEGSRVRLAVPSGFAKLFTPEWAELHDRYPKISLDLVSGAQPVDLKRGEADLAIRVGVPTDPELIARKLCESASALYASPAYLKRKPPNRDPEDLSGHELIGFAAALAKVPAAQWLEERAHHATFVMRSREMIDVVTAAVSGIGVALLPCHLGDAEPGLRRLTPKPVLSRTVWLLCRREARVSQPVRIVTRFVVEVMKRHADAFAGRAANRG
jgi:DNA-binding transcriptional LysR family regulator